MSAHGSLVGLGLVSSRLAAPRQETITPPDFTTLLGRLLTDSVLRDELAADPAALAQRHGLSAADSLLLAQLDPAQLEAQARLLLGKRLHEARKLLPRSFAALDSALGCPKAAALFNSYAEAHWPADHRRHIEDALNFGALLARHHQRGARQALDRAEYNRLRFAAHGRRFMLGLVRIEERRKSRLALQILYRSKGRPSERYIYSVV